jgi:hypothetical protein
MPILGIVMILGAAALAWMHVKRPDIIEGIIGPKEPETPPPAPEPSPEQVAAARTLVGAAAGIEVGGGGGAGIAGLEIGAALTGAGATSLEAAALGAGAGVLIAGGPLGALVGGGLALYSSQQVLMAEVAEFRSIQFMMDAAEQAKWQGMKNKSTTWPTSADPWRHKSLHDYENTMTDKYLGLEGQAEFRERLTLWMLQQRQPETGIAPKDLLSEKGKAWAAANGILQMPLKTAVFGTDAEKEAWLASQGYTITGKVAT